MDKDEIEELLNGLSKEAETNHLTNHIKKNIQLSSKISKIRDIQLFYRNLAKDNNTNQIKEFKEEIEVIQRSQSLQHLHKWDDFRHRKDVAIDLYCKVKKDKIKVKILLTQILLFTLIRELKLSYDIQMAK